MDNPIENILNKLKTHYKPAPKPAPSIPADVLKSAEELASKMTATFTKAQVRDLFSLTFTAVSVRDDLDKFLAAKVNEPELLLFLEGLATGLEFAIGLKERGDIDYRVNRLARGCGDPACTGCNPNKPPSETL